MSLLEVLASSQRLGLLGPGDLSTHATHAAGFGWALDTARHRSGGDQSAVGLEALQADPQPGRIPGLETGERWLDLGSGGGLPGLVLALGGWVDGSSAPEGEPGPGSSGGYLLDSHGRRAAFLRSAIDELELGPDIEVVEARAEQAARHSTLRGLVDVVVSRSFGRPAVTAECAAGFLRPGGWLVVSEPPDEDADRWPRAGLAELGLWRHARVMVRGFHYQVLEMHGACPDRFPRRVGIPAKRPLF